MKKRVVESRKELGALNGCKSLARWHVFITYYADFTCGKLITASGNWNRYLKGMKWVETPSM